LDQNLDHEKVIFGVQTIVYYIHRTLFDLKTSKKIVYIVAVTGIGKDFFFLKNPAEINFKHDSVRSLYLV
jgi:hypothetical protein